MLKIRQNSIGLVLTLLVISGQVIQSEATAFILGGACIVALEAAQAAIGSQIIAQGLTQAIEDVEAMCRFIQRYSVGGVIYYQILPLLTRLIRISGRLALADADGMGEFGTLIRSLADLSVEVTSQG